MADFERVLKHRLDRGVDGFQVEVAHTLFKAGGPPDAGSGQHQDVCRDHLMSYYDQEELHPLFRDRRALLDRHPAPPGAVSPGERSEAAAPGRHRRRAAVQRTARRPPCPAGHGRTR
ncbi:hypothetical protein ACFY0A_18285 [Streptomyces sp. NPDC001698]|uniref:hypothetical protein n=1 Tax=Streptomyces sp. NPDC001698 TaxID=3364601 RepID=UPI003695F35D